jgi:hypothetical protein
MLHETRLNISDMAVSQVLARIGFGHLVQENSLNIFDVDVSRLGSDWFWSSVAGHEMEHFRDDRATRVCQD